MLHKRFFGRNDNEYVMDLLEDTGISNTFNGADLHKFFEDVSFYPDPISQG